MAKKLLGGGISLSKARALYKLGKSYLVVNALKRPKIQYLEIMSTYACNAHCTHCSNERYLWKDPALKLTVEKIRDIIRQARDMDVPVIAFLGGEPLLDGDLCEYIRFARKCGILPFVCSNGQLLNDTTLARIKQSGLFCFAITVYSTDPAENEAITGIKGYLDTCLENFERGQAAGVQMMLKYVVTRQHFESGEIHRVINLAKRLDTWLSINPIVPTGQAHSQHREDVLDEPLQRELDELCRQLPFLTTHWTSNYFGYGCPAGKAYLGITPYGDVLACYFLPIAFGNIWESSLKDIHRRITKTPVFRDPYPGCFAAYNRDAIEAAISPCFTDASLLSRLPVNVEDHPLYDPADDVLALRFTSDAASLRHRSGGLLPSTG